MKPRTIVSWRLPALLLCCCALARGLHAQSANPSALLNNSADQDWQALVAAEAAAHDAADAVLAPKNGKQAAIQQSASGAKGVADLARDFYTKNPDHPKANEARKVEVFALIDSVQIGDRTAETRLDGLVTDLRSDPKVPVKLRAQCAAAHDFTATTRKARDRAERFKNVEQTGRSLIKEFPGEPQGYEALFALCQASNPAKAQALASELAGSDAPAEIKFGATVLLQRLALVGHSLAEVLGPEGAALFSGQPSGEPVVVYSWASWGPGSLDFARMIQARRFAAIGICVDADVEKAKLLAAGGGLGGKHSYDSGGLDGVLASRLAFSAPGQIYFVDSSGVIRDVQGGVDLENKFTQFGFKTPVLRKP
ncbi:MAG TPA: hypothetical protein VFJ90_06535 [Candidatus Didemnitutus sp.]|nr:hypothetical protein [Candidatus Didemnitutus sp.]